MTVYSFYSYKGGVGRSMTLANLAALFYRRPLNVIVVDWDLEAPGIERYFATQYPDARSERVLGHPGLCDLITTYRTAVATPPEVDEDPVSPYPSIDDHLITIDADRGCTLRLMPAGARHDWAAYAAFVQSFDWADFYAHWAGGGFFDWLREELVGRADVVLIDTRTGITEMGGVATRHMADVVVVMFAGNGENMESSARMAETFLAAHDDDRAVEVLLVPSRIDNSDSGEFSEFLSRLSAMEVRLAAAAPPDGWQTRDLLLPYHARLAFREQLVVGNDRLQVVLKPIADAYSRIAAEMQRRAPENSRLRRGAGVDRERVYLFEHPHQRAVGAQVRGILEAAGYEVAPSRASSTSNELDESELLGAGCVVALIDESTSKSRPLSKLLSNAERLGKTVIPVLLEPVLHMPVQLADVAVLEWTPSSDPDEPALHEKLLRAVTSISAPPAAPDTDHVDVFVCYAHGDAETAGRLAKGLQAQGITTWLDTDVRPGANWTDERQRALDDAEALVVLASTSLEASRWARQEVAYARSQGKVIVPVRLGTEPLALWLISWPEVDGTDQPWDRTVDRVADAVRRAGAAPPA